MYPGITLDRRYFIGGAWENYSLVAAAGQVEDARRLMGLLDLQGKRVGVLGCAYGFSVAELRLLGVDARGIDVSEFAISQAPTQRVRQFLLLGDATSPDGMQDLADRAGGPFDVLLDENLLPLLSDDEAAAACDLWRLHADVVVHRISMCCEEPRYYRPWMEREGARHNWHSPSEWRQIIGPMDRLIEFTSWAET